MGAGEERPTFEGWEVVEKLGEGGMCAVYRVRPSDGTGSERAVKVLQTGSADAARRFRTEAKLLSRIDHPNVLKIHQLVEDDDPPWILMDLLAGRDLEEAREEHGPMDPELAARIFADVASGLAAVHALGVRHRDVKPGNVMLGHDGVPRLIDFGIARETARAHITQHGMVIGTASYLPPEVFTGHQAEAQDTQAADIYALGQTLCELLTGRSVHEDTPLSGPALLVQIMKDKVDRPHLDPRGWWPSVPAGLAEIVMQATTREPERRIPTALELERRLRAWLADRLSASHAPLSSAFDPTALPPPPTPTPSHQDAAPLRQAAGAAAAASAGFTLVLALVGGVTLAGLIALWAFAPQPPPAPERQADRIAHTVARTRFQLGQCTAAATRGELVVALRVEGRAARAEVLRSTVPEPRVANCLKRTLEEAPWPPGDRVRVRVPIRIE